MCQNHNWMPGELFTLTLSGGDLLNSYQMWASDLEIRFCLPMSLKIFLWECQILRLPPWPLYYIKPAFGRLKIIFTIAAKWHTITERTRTHKKVGFCFLISVTYYQKEQDQMTFFLFRASCKSTPNSSTYSSINEAKMV